MRRITQFSNITLITGTTADTGFILAKNNEKQIAIPVYEFSITNPEVDFIPLTEEIIIKDETFYNEATAYNYGIALSVNNSAYAIPMYKVIQNDANHVQISFENTTIVSSLTSINQYLIIKVDDICYGLPLYTYSTIWPTLTTVTPAVSTITTELIVNPTVDFRQNTTGSTTLNAKIKTYSDLITRIKYTLGHPIINLEICDDFQLCDNIDIAIEWYTKYAGYTEEYLVFRSDLYEEPGLRIDELFSLTETMRNTTSTNLSACKDYDLADYRKVIGIFDFKQGETTGINTLFTLEQAMAQQTYFSYMLGNVGFDLVTWEVLKGWLKLREKVLAQIPYIDFDNRNQLLRIIPPPKVSNSIYYGVVGAWVEKPIRDLIMERWIYQYALALTKITIGNIRGKYQSMTLFGGGTINYNDLLSQGLKEKEELEKELMNGYGEVTPARFFLG